MVRRSSYHDNDSPQSEIWPSPIFYGDNLTIEYILTISKFKCPGLGQCLNPAHLPCPKAKMGKAKFTNLIVVTSGPDSKDKNF